MMTKENTDQLLEHGEDLFATGDLPGAEELFRKILNLDPQHIHALNNIGVIAFMRSDYKNALDCFSKALEIDELYPKAIENYSKSLITVGEHLEALNFIRESIKKGIINTELLNMMGNCFLELGDLKTAKTVFAKSLSINNSQQEIIEIKNRIENVNAAGSFFAEVNNSNKGINIGFISIWFERGQSYVSKAMRDALSHGNNTYVFARTGGVYGQPKLETNGYWNVPNLTTYPQYNIQPDAIKKWIMDNNLQVVIFNEEYDWNLVRAVKETGAKTVTYLDYYKKEWEANMGLYDMVLCSTHRTYNLIKDICKASYIGWCVDLDLFKPRHDEGKRYTFFHNAGWLGINYRKMTPAVILAFDAISKYYKDASLLVHAQTELEKLPASVIEIIRQNGQINYRIETIPAPGLYHKGKVLVFPSKLEGLGLPLPEGLACGLPAIVSDAPPMNEFVKHGYNGFLVKIAHRITREDNISFPEEIIDVNDLAIKMAEAVSNPALIDEMSSNARSFVEKELNPAEFQRRLHSALTQINE